ncbi:MAG: glycosyltransferase [Candidatus Eisenbacteria bacterium]|nr:glycosyltransferase [Candidatus Eisenbacteria bacterium]
MITDITPVILTYNEEANLDRTLAALTWASEIIIMDSLSTDRTIDIAHRHPRVRLLQRKFDDFASQWAYALEHAAIRTGWVLALDADYVLAPGFEEELRGIAGRGGVRVPGEFCLHDRRPAVTGQSLPELGGAVQERLRQLRDGRACLPLEDRWRRGPAGDADLSR